MYERKIAPEITEQIIRSRFIPDFRFDESCRSFWIIRENGRYTSPKEVPKRDTPRLYFFSWNTRAHKSLDRGVTFYGHDPELKPRLDGNPFDEFEAETAPQIAPTVMIVLRDAIPALRVVDDVYPLPVHLQSLARTFLDGELETELLLDAIKHDTEFLS